MTLGEAVTALQQDPDVVRTYEVLGAFLGTDRIGVTRSFPVMDLMAEAGGMTGAVLSAILAAEHMDEVQLANQGKALPPAVREAAVKFRNRFLNGTSARAFSNVEWGKDAAGEMLLIAKCFLDMRAVRDNPAAARLDDFYADLGLMEKVIGNLPALDAGVYPPAFLAFCASEGKAMAQFAARLPGGDADDKVPFVLGLNAACLVLEQHIAAVMPQQQALQAEAAAEKARQARLLRLAGASSRKFKL